MNIYGNYDNIACRFVTIVMIENDELAKRAFARTKFPPFTKANDYTLYRLGSIAENGISNPVHIALATAPAEDVHETAAN